MNLAIQTTFIQADDTYFQMLNSQLSKIVETPEFIEYVHNDKQIYIRHDKRIQKGDGCAVHIEPQVNMTRSVKFGFAGKLQLSILKHKMNYPMSMSPVSINIIADPLSKADFIDGLNVCEQWKIRLNEFVKGCDLPIEAQV
jgi:hypothetical protein